MEQLEIRASHVFWQQAPSMFLRHWKKAVALAGIYYFGDGCQDGLHRSTTWQQLTPDYRKIRDTLDTLPKSSAVFLAALYSFYNDQDAQVLLRQAGVGGIADITRHLDIPRRKVLADLMLTYTGW